MGPVIAVALGAVLGGFVQGLTGFAFGLVALGIWAWALELSLAGPLVVFGSLIGQLLSIGAVGRALELRRLLPFILGGGLGIPIGVVLLRHIEPAAFQLLVGLVLLAWCPVMLLHGRLPQITAGGVWADGAAGWVGGVMGGLGGLTGPAPTLWCALRGWSRDTQRAVFQGFNLTMQLATMATYVGSGLITAETMRLFAVLVPAMLVPTLIGVRVYRRVSDVGFQRLVLLLLSGSGAVTVATSLPRLL